MPMPMVLAQLTTGQTVCMPFEVMMTGTAMQAIVWATATSNSTATTIWPGCAANTTCGTTSDTVYWIAAPELVIDEEDYVNNAEYYDLARARGVAFRIRTAEERRRADEELARARAAAEAAQREREAADLRSRELLFKYLTAEQRRTVEKNKWFVVVGGKTGTKYRIRAAGVAGNIDVMRQDKVEATLCCHCSHDIPAPDQWLAQKIALQWDEESFLKTANRRAA